jgi:transposase-like protein
MPASHSLPDHINIQIQRPVCPNCSAHMMLARIMPARMGFDLRSFECLKCDQVRELMVETDAFGR